MSRGQERNISNESNIHPISFTLPKNSFLEIISDWYKDLVREEKEDSYYEEGEFWNSDIIRSKNYPDLASLWNDSEEIVAKLVLDSEVEFMDLVYITSDGWKEHNYYIHKINEFSLSSSSITFLGTCIYSPDQSEKMLGNLINNISNPDNHEDILLDSLKELRNGKSKAIKAISAIAKLTTHPSHVVSDAAKVTLVELENA